MVLIKGILSKAKAFIGFLVLGLFVNASIAVTEKDNRIALIIGIGEYESPEASPLPGVGADIESAKKMARAMGITDKNIVILRDREANKKNIMRALTQLSDKAVDGGRAFIYFSGHGTRSYDATSKQCYEGLLSYDRIEITNQEIAQATKKLNQNVDKTIVFFDACHSGGVLKKGADTRSLTGQPLIPKFYSKTGIESSQCAQVTNVKTRNLFDASTRLGAIQENLVFISAAKPDEVSYDEGINKGGIATQAVRDCLLGKAKDINSSGAISLEEIRACSQEQINQKLTGPVYLPHHVTVQGNRNLIPVPVQSVPQKPVEVANVQAPAAPANSSIPQKPISQPVPSNQTHTSSGSTVQLPSQVANQSQSLDNSKPVDKPIASIDTLKDIENQRNPSRGIEVKIAKSTLKINQDYLNLQVKSNQDGYLYVVLLGSDQKSFYLLYPNKLDKDNLIKAGVTQQLPGKNWQIKAAGPPGKNYLLLMVSETPRDLSKLDSLISDSNSPFLYSFANITGRTNLISYLINNDDKKQSEKFAAKLISINEVR